MSDDPQLKIEDGHRLVVGDVLKINLNTGDVEMLKPVNQPATIFWREVRKCVKNHVQESKKSNNLIGPSLTLESEIDRLSAQITDLKSRIKQQKDEIEKLKLSNKAYKDKMSKDRFSGMDI